MLHKSNRYGRTIFGVLQSPLLVLQYLLKVLIQYTTGASPTTGTVAGSTFKINTYILYSYAYTTNMNHFGLLRVQYMHYAYDSTDTAHTSIPFVLGRAVNKFSCYRR